ncbi:MAG: glutamate--tRNA ligase [Thaumarchaeota archaeon]|nr:glutamate--tRNA ligase [Candidatus Calditenuaceae archaeon]MDW8187358.1 glutamate--tRNA ligase [Nitrososphaerota archaeon]
MTSEDLRQLVYKWALKNAYDHGGSAQEKAVISKVIAERPELKTIIKELLNAVREVVGQVNTMSLDAITQTLSEVAPELMIDRRTDAKRRLPPLPNAVEGNVVTRLPPEPSGFMHIGHALSGLINYLYKEMYGGKVWLRFEDTDPRKVRPEYYDSYRDGYSWVGIRWDHEKNNSDDMELFYRNARRLVEGGKAYACTCGRDEMRRLRSDGIPCDHRSQPPEVNLELWDGMLEGRYSEGEVSLRLVGDMSSTNTTLRDPVIMRVVDAVHPLTGDRYRVWPTYDYAVSIEDAICGITHVLRTSEFMLRDELQNLIRRYLGMSNPTFVEYERFEFEGTPVSRREIRSLIERGLVSGWNDPRLATIASIRRRGILPQALKEFVERYVALTQSRKVYSWDLLYAINRRHVDDLASRMFFVKDPMKLKLDGIGELDVDLPLHPTRNLGNRRLRVTGEFYVPAEDLKTVGEGGRVRLKHLCNFTLKSVTDKLAEGVAELGPPEPGLKVIQWVPVNEAVEVQVLIPGRLFNPDGAFNEESLEIVNGIAERTVNSLEVGSHVQFERFGYCVKDSLPKTFILSHR